MQDLYQLMGRLEQSTVDIRGDISDLRGQIKELNTALNEIKPTLEKASEYSSDWNATKRKGLFWLAGVGASGIAAGAGGKSMFVWLAQLLPIFPK